MPHSETIKRSRRSDKPGKSHKSQVESRYTVALAPSLVKQVQQYAETVDASMSKAIAALVRLGLESQESRKREFFKRLRENLADDNSNEQDRLVDEFRALILGR